MRDLKSRKLLITVPDEILIDDDGRIHGEFDSVLSDCFCNDDDLFSAIEVCCWSDKDRERMPWNIHRLTTISDTPDYRRVLYGRKTAYRMMEDCVGRADLVLIVGPCRLGRLAAKFCRKSNKPYVVDITREYREAMGGVGLVERLHSIVLSRHLRELTRSAALVWEK